jgi:predicted phosphodiesterase
MKKIVGLFIIFLFSTIVAFGADMRFVQVDGTLFSTEDSSVNQLKNLVKDINKQKNVEFIIFTGDNIAKAKKENLEEFLKVVKDLKRPYYIALGGKDVNKQKHLGKKEYMEMVKSNSYAHKKINFPNYVIEKKDIVFIVVDGSKEVIPSSIGYYRAETLEWLQNQLSYYCDKNIVIFQHFPLIAPLNKESRLTFKPDEYLEMLKNYNNVKAIFAGNFNVNSEKEVDGILHFSTANAPQYRIVDIMDYETEKPIFWSVIKE